MPDRTTSDRPVVSIRFSAAEIAARVEEMATDLSEKLASDTLVVSVLKGSFVFAADLIRALSRAGADWSMDFLTLSSYGSGTETSGNVRVVRDIVDDVRDRDVLLVD
ncbi:MAG: phosphoribosyltransferase family protein, partial [Reyranella sp.]|nr:phosphoribosyltransferase family protein [Reyranella sp.]